MKYLHSFRRSAVFVLVTFGILSGTEMLFAQVTVAPSIVFIDARTGIGNLYLSNKSSLPQEVNIGFVFGYPDADTSGIAIINYRDSVVARTYSLNAFIKAYPRSFLLNANQEQTVRLQVRTKSAAKDAFLFTRLRITSAQKSPEIAEKSSEAITTQINLKFEQILPVYFRKGNVTTGLRVHDVSTSIKEKKLTALIDVERTGTAPFIGSVKAVLYSGANVEVARFEQTASVFFRVRHKLEIDISKATSGQHRLVITFETKRSDVAPEDLLQAPSVTKEVTVNLQ